jgi:hypothetical protein
MLSKKAQELLDMILGKTARVRDPGSPPPRKKLMQTEKGTWELVPDVQRFRKSGGEPTPALMNLLKAMTDKSENKADKLLKETSGVAMNEIEKRLVRSALLPEMAKSLRAHKHAFGVSQPGAQLGTPLEVGMLKRAPQTAITSEEMQGRAPVQPSWGHPRSEPGLSDEDLKVLEDAQIADAGTLPPAEMQRLLSQVHAVIQRNPKRGFPA